MSEVGRDASCSVIPADCVRRVKHIAISVRSRVLYIESRVIMHPAAYDSNDAEKGFFRGIRT
jgi:hypothetical protein